MIAVLEGGGAPLPEPRLCRVEIEVREPRLDFGRQAAPLDLVPAQMAVQAHARLCIRKRAARPVRVPQPLFEVGERDPHPPFRARPVLDVEMDIRPPDPIWPPAGFRDLAGQPEAQALHGSDPLVGDPPSGRATRRPRRTLRSASARPEPPPKPPRYPTSVG
jgi:hypothetical protein